MLQSKGSRRSTWAAWQLAAGSGRAVDRWAAPDLRLAN
jgi:hypothetical protein